MITHSIFSSIVGFYSLTSLSRAFATRVFEVCMSREASFWVYCLVAFFAWSVIVRVVRTRIEFFENIRRNEPHTDTMCKFYLSLRRSLITKFTSIRTCLLVYENSAFMQYQSMVLVSNQIWPKRYLARMIFSARFIK